MEAYEWKDELKLMYTGSSLRQCDACGKTIPPGHDICPVYWRLKGERGDISNLGCRCGHRLDEHRQLDADRFCVGDNFRCTCEGYSGREEA
jgi:hypothetical protein